MITGGTVKKISAERMKDMAHSGSEVNIRVGTLKFDKTKLLVTYTYEVTYKPDVAKMVIEGEIVFEENEKDAKNAKEQWEKTGQLPENMASDLLTAMTYTCSAIGTLLAFGINVSAPINVPRAKLMPAPETKPAG